MNQRDSAVSRERRGPVFLPYWKQRRSFAFVRLVLLRGCYSTLSQSLAFLTLPFWTNFFTQRNFPRINTREYTYTHTNSEQKENYQKAQRWIFPLVFLSGKSIEIILLNTRSDLFSEKAKTALSSIRDGVPCMFYIIFLCFFYTRVTKSTVSFYPAVRSQEIDKSGISVDVSLETMTG